MLSALSSRRLTTLLEVGVHETVLIHTENQLDSFSSSPSMANRPRGNRGSWGGGGSEGSKAYRVVHFKFIFMQFVKIHVYMYILIVGRPVI